MKVQICDRCYAPLPPGKDVFSITQVVKPCTIDAAGKVVVTKAKERQEEKTLCSGCCEVLFKSLIKRPRRTPEQKLDDLLEEDGKGDDYKEYRKFYFEKHAKRSQKQDRAFKERHKAK